MPDDLLQEVSGRILHRATGVLVLPFASLNFEIQHFTKASLGIDMIDVPRCESLCAWAILTPEVTAVPDLRTDERIQDSPLAQHHSYSVVMVDLNGRKAVNDTHGHAEGDLLLQTFARQVIRGLYASNLAYWLGGDESALVLRDPPADAKVLARIIGERLKRTVAQTQAQRVATVNTSLGWVSVSQDTLQLADQQMYRHKASRGRQRKETDGPTAPDQVSHRAER